MFKHSLKLSLLFVFLLFVQVVGDSNVFPSIAGYTGPLTIAVLIFMLVSSTRLRGRFHRRLLFGLVTLLIGEVVALFMHSDSGLFLYGMICCTIAYLFFTSAFYLDFRSAPELDKKGARIAILLAIVLSFSAYLYLRPFLAAYRIPVLVYTFILSLMAMMASFRRLRINQESFLLVLCGTGVLIVSDFLLATQTFEVPFDAGRYAIGITHFAALYLIVVGGMKRVLHPEVSSS